LDHLSVGQRAWRACPQGRSEHHYRYADRFIPENEQEPAAHDGDAVWKITFLERFTVFDVDQCEGLSSGLPGIDASSP